MTQETTPREVIAEALFRSSCGAGYALDSMTWAEFKAHHGPEYEGVRRMYRRADDALAGLGAAGLEVRSETVPHHSIDWPAEEGADDA